MLAGIMQKTIDYKPINSDKREFVQVNFKMYLWKVKKN